MIEECKSCDGSKYVETQESDGWLIETSCPDCQPTYSEEQENYLYGLRRDGLL